MQFSPISVCVKRLLISMPLLIAHYAQADDAPADAVSIDVGAGVVSSPRYAGSAQRFTRAVPIINVDAHYGDFELGSSKGLLWTPLHSAELQAGLLLGLDGGRSDSNSYGRPGGDHLKGMGDVSATLEYGAFVSASPAGIPISARLHRALGQHGHGGSLIDFGLTPLSYEKDGLELGLTLSAQWASSKYSQAYFGVTQGQSNNTGFRVYTPGSGFTQAGLDLGAKQMLGQHWYVSAGAGYHRLLGDAGKSPIVERKGSATVSLMAGYHF